MQPYGRIKKLHYNFEHVKKMFIPKNGMWWEDGIQDQTPKDARKQSKDNISMFIKTGNDNYI